ncbi:MAG: phosphate ABC transporter permease subunit PstC [Phycisphaerae bacterium]
MRSQVQKTREGLIHGLLLACGLASIITTVGIVWVLFSQSTYFFQHVTIAEFLTGTVWRPRLVPESFGVLPLVCGTFVVAFGALLIALPIGLAAALYLSEYAPPTVRQLAKPVLELLAGIPTVVYGFFAISFITPHLLRPVFPQVSIFNALSAAIVVGIMIVPTICSLCDDAFRAVPQSLRQGAFALAATKAEVSLRVVFPAALSGVTAAVLLALARAVGETMAVALAAGNTPNFTLNPLQNMQTMTGYIVQVASGDTDYRSTAYYSIFAVGATLFLITLAINLVAQRVLARFREAYD